MQNMMLMSLLCSLPAGAMAGDCANAVHVFKTGLAGKSCSGALSATNCQAECCEVDKLKCAGVTVTCDTDKYSMKTAAAGNIGNKATTTATAKADCCVLKKTCKDLTTCKTAGYKKDTTKDATKCPNDAVSCDSATFTTCCIKDDTKCGGQAASIACATPDKYIPQGDATWAAKSTTAATAPTDCCMAKATCAAATYSCSDGYKKKTTGNCNSDDASCALTCCEADDTKCGGLGATCTTPKVKGSSAAWKKTAATAATFQTACCGTAPVCKDVACPKGTKAKTSAAALTCADQSATLHSCIKKCCELDVATCGGLTGMYVDRSGTNKLTAAAPKACAATTYLASEAITATSTKAVIDAAYGKAATAATFEADCCTKKATCDAFKASSAGNQVTAGAQQVHPGLFIVFLGLSTFTALWKM